MLRSKVSYVWEWIKGTPKLIWLGLLFILLAILYGFIKIPGINQLMRIFTREPDNSIDRRREQIRDNMQSHIDWLRLHPEL